jgi:acetyl esterase/lipase
MNILYRVHLAIWMLGFAAAICHGQEQSPLPAGVRLIPNIEYAHPDGHSLLMDLYLPKRSGVAAPAPVIVYVHGGAWLSGDRHDRLALPLVAQGGYAVASIEYRLSQVATFPAQIEDCKAAVRWLRAKSRLYDLDPAHIGAWGTSAGGHLAALLGTTGDVKELEGDEGNLIYSSRVQAVCDWFGPTDFLQIGQQAKHLPVPSAIDHDAPDSPEAKLIGGPIKQNSDKAKAANPITYITKDDAPFLILHGDRDPLVPLAQSQLLDTALKAAGVESTLVIVQGAGHGFGGKENLQKVQEFFDKHLKKPAN